MSSLGQYRFRADRSSRLLLFTPMLLGLVLLSAPAGAVDWSKCPPQGQRPPDAPLGWSHWWGAVQFMKEGDCKAAIMESDYLLKHPQNSNAVYSQKVLILQGECFERLRRPDLQLSPGGLAERTSRPGVQGIPSGVERIRQE